MNNSKRIIKNTIALYFRMLFLTAISFFTVRIVLDSLGEENYGLYNVVGGFVVFFTLITGTLSHSSQRYFSLSLANNDWKSLNSVFSTILTIYLFLCLLIFIISVIIGPIFIENILNIPNNRINSCLIVFNISVISFVLSLLISPLQAILIADENLTFYSYLSIFEAIAKITVVYLLYVINGDKLIIYSILVFTVNIITNLIYFIYIKKRYKQLKYVFKYEKNQLINILNYVKWNLIGALGQILKGQGVNIIINIYFGASINAARAISVQISTIVANFSRNFMSAVDPQITKRYAINKQKELNKLLNTSSKLSFFLLYIIAFPLIITMEYVLNLWLGNNIPSYTIILAKLILIDLLITSVTEPILTAVQANGNIRKYQLCVGGIVLLNLPLSYLLLNYISNPIVPFIISIILSIGVTTARIIIYNTMTIDFSINQYLRKVIIPVLIVTFLSIIFSIFFIHTPNNFTDFIFKVAILFSFSIILIISIGMNKEERDLLKSFIKNQKK